jgi:hypothetical protein
MTTVTTSKTASATTVHEAEGHRGLTRALTGRIPLRLVLAVAALWMVGLYVVFSLAPAPTGDPSTTAILIGLAFDLALLGMIAGFAVLQRWGLLASAAGGAVLLFGAGLCSLAGHTGGWLVAQYVTGAMILGVSRAAFRRF